MVGIEKEEISWGKLDPVAKDRLGRMHRVLTLGWDLQQLEREQVDIPEAERIQWAVPEAGKKKGEKARGTLIFTPELVKRMIADGMEIYERVKDDPILGPHARRLFDRAAEIVDNRTQARREARKQQVSNIIKRTGPSF